MDINEDVKKLRSYRSTGKISVSFILPEKYAADGEVPRPYYMIISRNAYLGSYVREISDLFKSFAIESGSKEVWFSIGDYPLHWHIPFGAIVDSYFGDLAPLPIELSVNYSNFPQDKLLNLRSASESKGGLQGLQTLQDHFEHSLKEFFTIRYGDPKIWILWNSQETKQLWKDLSNENYLNFEKNFHNICSASASKQLERAAVRIVLKNTSSVFQRSVEYKTESGDETTIGSLFAEIFPKIKVADKWEDKKNASGVYIVIIQGIRMPLDTKISFAFENLSNFDGFLYISLV